MTKRTKTFDWMMASQLIRNINIICKRKQKAKDKLIALATEAERFDATFEEIVFLVAKINKVSCEEEKCKNPAVMFYCEEHAP